MDSARTSPVLAIDGGGTRCRAAFCDGGAVLSVETGSANVSTDFDAAVREIVAGLVRLAELAGRSRDALSALPAFIGLAGVTGPAIAERLRAALPLKRARIADDRPAALRGALGRRNGVVAHCGTGSFFAAQRDGAMRFAGGWGPVLGDEASAQWAGRAALRLTLEAVDGRRAATPLTERLLADFGGAAGVVRFAGAARPADFGALAPQVTACAGRGDAVAVEIMRLGAAEIARALPHLGWSPGEALCLTGGIGPRYADWLDAPCRAALTAPEGAPLDGALALARDFAAEIDHERR